MWFSVLCKTVTLWFWFLFTPEYQTSHLQRADSTLENEYSSFNIRTENTGSQGHDNKLSSTNTHTLCGIQSRVNSSAESAHSLWQVVLSVFAKLILCTYLTQESMKLIPLLVCLFLLGRLTFWIGYLRYPLHRAFGFATTALPTFITLVYCCYCIFAKGPGFDIVKV